MKVSLSWGISSEVYQNDDLDDLVIMQLKEKWENQTTVLPKEVGGTWQSGSITTSKYLSEFGFFTLGSQTPIRPLPVTFGKFGINTMPIGVQLEWSTSQEINNKGFEVQRSADGFKSFEIVGFVEGAGRSSMPESYTFIDTKVGIGELYYRLKQIDFNGEFSFSEIKYINDKGSRTVANGTIFPNPTHGEVTVVLDGLELGSEVDFTIISGDGKVKARKSNISINQLDFVLSQSLLAIGNGSYTILLKTKRNNIALKVVKI